MVYHITCCFVALLLVLLSSMAAAQTATACSGMQEKTKQCFLVEGIDLNLPEYKLTLNQNGDIFDSLFSEKPDQFCEVKEQSNRAVTCVTNHIKKCLPSSLQDIMPDAVSLNKAMDHICENRADLNLPCIEAKSIDLFNCGQEEVKKMIKEMKNSNKQVGIKESMCLAYEVLPICQKKVLKSCGCFSTKDKEIYLLDDPLSAVDAHVAEHIFSHCIRRFLHDRTRLICTHHVKFLARADLIIVMEEGRILKSGCPSEILDDYLEDENCGEPESHKQMEEPNEEEKECGVDKLIEEEAREEGVVKSSVYKAYWKAVGSCLSPLILISLFFMQVSRNTSDWWLSYWVSHSVGVNNSVATNFTSYMVLWTKSTLPWTNLTTGSDNLRFYLGIYGGLTGANSIFTLLRAFLFAFGGVCAAKEVHEKLLGVILKAPMAFFDSTPIGRIINRFSSDLYAVDDSLPFILNIFLAQAYGIIGTLVITCYGLPWFAISLIPLGAIYYIIQNYYRFTSRELKRLSSVTLSPVYAHFSETITGLAVIKAMRHSKRFCQENVQRLDTNQRAQYATQLAARWLDFNLRMLGVAMVTILSLIAVIQHQYSSVNAGLVGLAISYSLSVTSLLGGVVMAFTETEKEMVSMERCEDYITNTASEIWEGSLLPLPNWPDHGVIEFNDVFLQYPTSRRYALNDVSFKIQAGEKVGIVGRTGAGKSSLFLALFRLMELCGGQILVDGVSIVNFNLSSVRSRFAIIPQDPFLFSGCIRGNLDPIGYHSDVDLWRVLECCHLRQCVSRLGGLGASVTEGGKEFSSGQKQLICLARAMLTQTKILCIDEATASVDMETDSAIQDTIRQEFNSSTVLTIAHRINTVMDSDRVLVMKDGTVAEFDSPHVLLRDSNSMFFQFVHGKISSSTA